MERQQWAKTQTEYEAESQLGENPHCADTQEPLVPWQEAQDEVDSDQLSDPHGQWELEQAPQKELPPLGCPVIGHQAASWQGRPLS